MSDPAPTHVYIVGFSDGIVKVGRTSDFRKRCWAYRCDALKRGAAITRSLLIESDEAKYAEWHLRMAGSAIADRAWGSEYFRADFDQFVTDLEARFAQWGKADLLSGTRTHDLYEWAHSLPVDIPGATS